MSSSTLQESGSTKIPLDPRSLTQAARLTEEQVGIQGYINTQPGFRGTLKYRYSDFIVHEVDLNKNIIRLTDTNPESAEKQRRQQPAEEPGGALTDEERAAVLTALIGEANAQKVLELERAFKAGDADAAPVILEPEPDKKKRTDVHQCIKTKFPTLSTDSIKVADGRTAIRISAGAEGSVQGDWNGGPGRANKRQKGGDAIYQGRRNQPSDLKFLKFVLLKENYDTMSAVVTLARLLRVPPSTFAYAGTKARRRPVRSARTAERAAPLLRRTPDCAPPVGHARAAVARSFYTHVAAAAAATLRPPP
jgi:tRNA pseudouridine13 synthase